jgi:hypothetical protein
MGVAALDSATGAAIASAAMTPAAKAARLLIGLVRLVVGKGLLLLVRAYASVAPGRVDDRGVADQASSSRRRP